MKKRLAIWVVFLVTISLFAFVDRTPVEAAIIVDFESATPGSSVEGLGTVAPDLNINATFGTAIVIEEGNDSTRVYRAPNIAVTNGCLGNPGDYVSDGGSVYGRGFSDRDSSLLVNRSESGLHH